MDYKIIERDPTQVVGIRLRTTNEGGKAAEEIPVLWHRFMEDDVYGRIPYQKTGEVVCVYCEYQKDHTQPYTVIAGCETILTSELPQDLSLKHLPAAKFAVFHITGNFPESVIHAWEWIWEGHLDRTFTYDMEIYPIGFDREKNSDMLLYISIK